MIKILKNGTVYSPDHLGIKDILIVHDKIGYIADEIPVPRGIGEVQVHDCSGKILTPGFIDGHVHLIGGGGEGGPTTRTPEVMLSRITTAGITTVVGCLGTDGITRNMASLLAKARALEAEGITTFIYTGSYEVPTTTITGSIRSDLVLIDKVIGVGEIAISDHRSSQPTRDQLAHLAAEARVGGMLGGKPGIVHLHVGSGSEGISVIFDFVENTEIPVSQFLPTHMGRTPQLLDQAVELCRLGGRVDLTAGRRTAGQVAQLLQHGARIEQITISSDGNGSMPRFDEKGNLVGLGIGSPKTVYQTWKECVQKYELPISQALKLVTENPAAYLDLTDLKGRIAVGADADILVLTEQLEIDSVFARGREMVREGKPLVLGTFEE